MKPHRNPRYRGNWDALILCSLKSTFLGKNIFFIFVFLESALQSFNITKKNIWQVSPSFTVSDRHDTCTKGKSEVYKMSERGRKGGRRGRQSDDLGRKNTDESSGVVAARGPAPVDERLGLVKVKANIFRYFCYPFYSN